MVNICFLKNKQLMLPPFHPMNDVWQGKPVVHKNIYDLRYLNETKTW